MKIFMVNTFSVLLFLVSACQMNSKNVKVDESPMKLFIGDGKLFIEKSHNHVMDSKRTTAGLINQYADPGLFKPIDTAMPGRAWVDESSEYTLLPELKKNEKCEIQVTRYKPGKIPASYDPKTSFMIKVRVKDGIKEAPFEVLINGEEEGDILLGTYPVQDWKGTAREGVIEAEFPHWSYTASTGEYVAIKSIGENKFLKKVLNFDPLLRHVGKIHYEILFGNWQDGEESLTSLARLDCKS